MEPEEGAFPVQWGKSQRRSDAEEQPCGALRASRLGFCELMGLSVSAETGGRAELQITNPRGCRGAASCRGWARVLKAQIQFQNDLGKLEE